MDEDYLLNKRYINKKVYNANDNIDGYLKEQQKFREFMENQDLDYDDINDVNDIDEDLVREELPLSVRYKELEKSEKRIQIRRNLEQGNIDFFKNYNQSNDLGAPNLRPSQPQIRFTQEKRHLIYVDSRNRDKTLYPEQNLYKIILKKTYTNVVAIKLKSTEFINSQQLIRNTPFAIKNNVLKWQMGDNGEEDDRTAYSAILTPGNYSASQLSTLIQNSMNSIVRTNGKLFNFTVTIDVVSDLVQFSSIDYETVSNPFTITAGGTSTTFIVNYTGAGSIFSLGQFIYIDGSSSIGGISSSDINGTHVIIDLSLNSFSFIVSSTATSDVFEGGGSSVNIGKGLNFRLLFSDSQSPAEVLGFPENDTPYSINVTNNIETYFYKKISNDEGITVDIVPTTTSGTSFPKINDYLYKNSNNTWSYNVNPYNISTTFNIDEDTRYILSDSSNVRLSIKSISKPSLHLTTIIDNVEVPDTSQDNIYSVITCNLPHGLATGDRIYIYNSDSAEFDNSNFNGFMSYKHLYGIDYGLYDPSMGGDMLTEEDSEKLTYFVNEITNAQGLFIITDNNLTDNTYKFKVSIPYASIDLIDARITHLIENNYYANDLSSTLYRENFLFGNIILTEVNQNLNLSGEQYILMTSSILGDGETTGEVDNVYSKIQLAASSGSNIFNAYIGGQKYFYDSPLPILREIDIQFYTNAGTLFEFYDTDHSFTLEIVEAIQKIEGTGFSSQIGSST